MTRSIVFVTTELPPTGSGGAGALVARTRDLLGSGGDRVRVVLVGPDAHPDPEVVVVPAADDPEAISQAAAAAVAEIVGSEQVDLVEFQDFYGVGYTALADRARFGLATTTVAVRLHGPAAWIYDAIDHYPVGSERYLAMERMALKMADVVLAPSTAMAGYAVGKLDLDSTRVAVAEPALSPSIAQAAFEPAEHPQVVFYGKRAEVKGAPEFLEAALPLLQHRPELEVRFLGSDSWNATAGASMTEYLRARIPTELFPRISFEPLPAAADIASTLRGAWLVVVPSRFETFCLAAHDVKAAGYPLLVSDLPAFRGYFDEATGAVRYDGTTAGMQRAMEELLNDSRRLAALAASPLPDYSDPTEFYRGELTPIRHPQSQAGLATIAVKEIEEVGTAGDPTSHRWGRRLLRLLPRPVAALAVKLMPARLKDRFRRVASWPEEEARRRRAARHEATARLGVELEPAPEPEVSVIIPCFEQGEWLMDAISSVYEQDHESWEIVVVDDGSTGQATIDAVATVEGFKRVSVIRQENAGLPAARNAAANSARGEFLVPLDADDELAAGFLSEMTAALRAAPRAAFAHCWAELYGDVSEVWITRPFNLYQLLMTNSVMGCVLLRREAWHTAGGYDESMTNGNEDWELWIRLLLNGWQQVQVPKPLFRYRRLGASMSAHTEARFEAGWNEIRSRHAASYAPLELATLKRGWYPAVSIIASSGDELQASAIQDLDDCEVIFVAADPDEATLELCRRRGWPLRQAQSIATAVGVAKGKFVCDAGSARWASATALAAAVAELEQDAEAYAVGGATGPLLWRRWALIDGRSPHSRVLINEELGESDGETSLDRGAFVDPAWELPDDMRSDLPIHRQSPEVEAFVPASR